MITSLREEFNRGTSKSIAWRKKQLQQIVKMYEENIELIGAAVRKDHGSGKVRVLAEVGPHKSAEEALANLDSWTADETVGTPFLVSPTRLGKSHVRREPKGVVLVIAPWNYPMELCLSPLVSAIAAGNCAVVKPSEVSANSAKVIEELINKYLDTTCIKVVQGAVPETTALLKLQWDHIFFTGNGAVGRIVMRAAAEHLTPVTLELGGKSPCIIDKTARLSVVASRVTLYKWLNVGQTCIAPDYLIVHESRKKEVVKALMDEIEKQYGSDPKKSPDLGRVINERHIARLSDLLKNSDVEVACGGLDAVDPETHYFPPTIVFPRSLDEPVLKEEIFGPILPVVTYTNPAEIMPIVNKVCAKPLAFYIYSEDKKLHKDLMANSQSGAVGLNTCVEHFGNSNLPFGGVGGSGMGCTHGKWGFEEFTHKRAVLHQDSLIKRDAQLPPFPHPAGLYDILVKVAVTGFIPRPLRGVVKNVTRVGLFCVLVWAVKKMLSTTP
eukprot:TRINITY_DN12832_c0_g1_i2.p1 TRINITY_DN12832_c0_g1~~TRINITY_DN12832_c0_g1_i2.p1  ORF type:complete len:545 (+),score=231.65 TRINITY_DN12832_c0_g1_i2:150-1637(+)